MHLKTLKTLKSLPISRVMQMDLPDSDLLALCTVWPAFADAMANDDPQAMVAIRNRQVQEMARDMGISTAQAELMFAPVRVMA